MCGIAGEVGLEVGPSFETVKKMTRTLTHRGPDGEGYFRSDLCAFGVRRLAIIDVKNGNQPIRNEDGSVILIFNGEIYNHKDIRNELIESGQHKFSTNCDT